MSYYVKNYGKVESKEQVNEIYEAYDEQIDKIALRIMEYARHNYGKNLSYRDSLIKATEVYDLYGNPKNIGDCIKYNSRDDEIVIVDSEKLNESADKEAKNLEALINEIQSWYQKKNGKELSYSNAFRAAGNLLSEVDNNYERALKIVKNGKIEDYIWV